MEGDRVLLEKVSKVEVELPGVSIVVIGRNEAGNLPKCIQSIREMEYPKNLYEVLYVDTGSCDGSPDIARSLSVIVSEVHNDLRTPGSARNRGWQEARYEIVHFVDGDMTVDPCYLKEAVKYLMFDNVACVIGKLIEEHSSHNLVSFIFEYPWKIRQAGFVDAPGAGGTFKKAVLQQVGGYRGNLMRGEEPELGMRLRDLGYRILMLEHPMGTHDYGIHNVRDLCTRFQEIGNNFASILLLPPSSSLAAERLSAQRSAIEGVLAASILVGLMSFRLWHLFPVFPILLALYVLTRYWQPARFRYSRISYFMLDYFLKPVVWFGMATYLFSRWMLHR